MTAEQKIVLSLIEIAVRSSPADLIKEDLNWKKVIDFATRQGVQGLCFDALELMPAEHQPVEDMDIYLGGCWQQADRLVSERLGIRIDDGHEHHTCFTFQGVSVENHYNIVH